MAKLAAHNSLILIDGFAASGFLNSWENTVNQELVNVTGFRDTGPRRAPGNYDYSFPLQGFFDGDDDSVDEIINGMRDDNNHYLTLIPAGTVGSAGRSGVVKLEGDPRTGAVGGAIMLNHTWQGTSGLTRSTLIYGASATGTGAGTGYNLGATTSGTTFAAFVHVVSGTFSSVTVRIQESSDDAAADAYADISGMTTDITGTGESGVTRLTTTAATEAWKRVNIEAFTGTSALIYVAVGLVAGE